MPRKSLSLPVQDNSVPHSTFYERVNKARKQRENVVIMHTGRIEFDITDSPFNKLMQSNRGVL